MSDFWKDASLIRKQIDILQKANKLQISCTERIAYPASCRPKSVFQVVEKHIWNQQCVNLSLLSAVLVEYEVFPLILMSRLLRFWCLQLSAAYCRHSLNCNLWVGGQSCQMLSFCCRSHCLSIWLRTDLQGLEQVCCWSCHWDIKWWDIFTVRVVKHRHGRPERW